ncbi:hypothetical protein ACFLQ2_00995 [archaeon]
MIGLLAAIALIFLGASIKSELLIGFGFIAIALQLTLDRLQPRPLPQAVAQAAARPRLKHKLIEAPEDMWEKQEDKTWQAMMSGGPSALNIGGAGNFMGFASRGIGSPMAGGLMRGMLPFQNYGSSGVAGILENMFIGFPMGMGNFFGGNVPSEPFSRPHYTDPDSGEPL